ncbi:MAG: hypothetical protein ACREF3_16075 [Acetobacteraceae bacterium]
MARLLGTGIAQLSWRVVLAFTFGGAGASQASFISTSSPPDLFPTGSFITGGPPVCVAGGPLKGVCTSNTRTTIASSVVSFPGDGNEDVVLDGLVTGDTSHPTGTFSLAGTEDLTIIGRSGPFQNGTFAIDITSEDFVGSFFGHTIALSLDPAGFHQGQITISELNRQNGSLIDIGLTISHDISVDGGPPTSIGTAHATVELVPEPGVLALLGLPLCALLCVRLQWGSRRLDSVITRSRRKSRGA